MPTSREIRFHHAGIELAGTLHLPDGTPPYPAAIMVHGSGDADRDSGGFFTPIREHLVASGLAVLSWDKPGNGDSGGDWRLQTIPERADETLAAFAWLRQQADIDPAHVATWGHSQGGWVGPLAASREPDVAALVIHSGTGLTPFEQDYFGMEHVLRREGATDEDVAGGRAFLDSLHEAAIAGMPFDQFDREIQAPARGTPWHSEYFGEVDEPTWQFFLLNAADPFDPQATLRAVTCPTLAIFGSDDVLVPAEESAQMLWDTVGITNPDVTIRIYPGAGHRLALPDGAYPDGYLDAMSRWLVKRLAPASR
ncbi:MAG TPA: alpha/beta hydrolase [Thermomicrobiales bacterium]|nr:alpha/beta hydrolase [Thermomicrobiales bacterium]